VIVEDLGIAPRSAIPLPLDLWFLREETDGAVTKPDIAIDFVPSSACAIDLTVLVATSTQD
jgi:hypothetical protein